jgi:hypothetical protein
MCILHTKNSQADLIDRGLTKGTKVTNIATRIMSTNPKLDHKKAVSRVNNHIHHLITKHGYKRNSKLVIPKGSLPVKHSSKK